jgi:peptidoglycan/xylan/chitin deacetylase (PgdA/CDA1 family)
MFPFAAAPGLYILNYHDVSYESSILTRGVGYHHSPDVFARHVEEIARAGELVSTRDALERLLSGQPFSVPTFAIWFDDGFAGVRRFAAPILARHRVTAAVSICSRFVERSETYWHCMLSCLRFSDSLRFLRERLRAYGYDPKLPLKPWLSRHFSLQVLSVVRSVYEERVPEGFRRDAFRIFETEEGLRDLAEGGWIVANHTASHHPVGALHGREHARMQFAECAPMVQRIYDGPRLLVVPFGTAHLEPTPASFYYELGVPGTVVDVGNRVNTPESYRADRVVYRINPVWQRGKTAPLVESLDSVF